MFASSADLWYKSKEYLFVFLRRHHQIRIMKRMMKRKVKPMIIPRIISLDEEPDSVVVDIALLVVTMADIWPVEKVLSVEVRGIACEYEMCPVCTPTVVLSTCVEPLL